MDISGGKLNTYEEPPGRGEKKYIKGRSIKCCVALRQKEPMRNKSFLRPWEKRGTTREKKVSPNCLRVR